MVWPSLQSKLVTQPGLRVLSSQQPALFITPQSFRCSVLSLPLQSDTERQWWDSILDWDIPCPRECVKGHYKACTAGFLGAATLPQGGPLRLSPAGRCPMAEGQHCCMQVGFWGQICWAFQDTVDPFLVRAEDGLRPSEEEMEPYLFGC